MSVKAEAEVFRKIPLFAECDRAHLQTIAFSSERAEFEKGEELIRQGEKGDAGYLILRGSADVLVRERGKIVPVAVAEAGAFVGELGMIAGLPHAVTVVARGPLGAARIPRDLFMRAVSEFPEFGAKVFASLSRKLDGSMSELKTVKAAFDQARTFDRR